MAQSRPPSPSPQQQDVPSWIPPRGLSPDLQQMRKLSAHEYLPDRAQSLSKAFEDFAKQLMEQLPDHPARTESLKSLVKAREMALEVLLPR